MTNLRDFLELPIDLEYYDEDTTLDLWVHWQRAGVTGTTVVKNVTSGIRTDGFWCINYSLFGRPAEDLFVASDVTHFTVFVNLPPKAEEEAP